MLQYAGVKGRGNREKELLVVLYERQNKLISRLSQDLPQHRPLRIK